VKNFGIRNLKKVWNPESIGMESGIQPRESGIHGVESGIHDSLAFLYMGRKEEEREERREKSSWGRGERDPGNEVVGRFNLP